jgi:hypothetical protein
MQMHELIYLLLGWLLGLLGPAIVERIRRKHRRRDLISSVVGELTELQFTLAFVAFQLRSKLATVTDEFLDWLMPIVDSYDGPGKNSRLAGMLVEVRAHSEAERRQIDILLQGEGRGLTLKKYEVPFLEGQAAELSICPLDFQRRVFRVKGQLNQFNQQVSYLQGQFEKTFDPSIVGANRENVERNLVEGYAAIAKIAEMIARAVDDIMRTHRTEKEGQHEYYGKD